MLFTTAADLRAMQSLGGVPTMLRVVSETTGLGFVCIARVDADSWTTCAVYDKLGFGLQVGDSLDLASTLCNDVRQSDRLIVMNKASEHPDYRDHDMRRLFRFESYISVPVYRADGQLFGTLWGLDPQPAELDNPRVIDTMLLFADLIARQLADEQRLSAIETALSGVHEAADLRERFIAVLGHDVRTPLTSILNGAALLRRMGLGEQAQRVIERIERSGRRIASLVDDLVDFTHGRMGDGIDLRMASTPDLRAALLHVIEELRDIYPQRQITHALDIGATVHCDARRVAQLLSNLLINALIYGDKAQPVHIAAGIVDGMFELMVTNGGAPLSESTLAALFQPFWRGDDGDGGAGANSGLGLGLYIVAEIARAHGGAMRVTSKDGVTRFVFSMPVAPA